MHGNMTRLICFQPSHLPPSELSRAELFPGASSDLFQTGIYLPRASLTSARHCGFYYFGDKGADHCGKGDNRNPDGDKEPLKTMEGATHGKVYLRDDSCPFNVSSFLDLYAHNLKWLCSYSGKELKIIIFLEAHPHIFRLSLIWFSSWHP